MKTIPIDEAVSMIPAWREPDDRGIHGLRHARAADG